MRKYLFVLCSHNSGSTTLWQLLQTSPTVSYLPTEGQWVEGVEPIIREDPWSLDKKLPWEKIKSEWEKIWDMNKPILLEKSPPNLVHALDIEKVFKEAYFIVMVRNPYAFCEGSKRKYQKTWSYQSLAERWVTHARCQIRNINQLNHVTYFTYAEFTENLNEVSQRILDFLPELEEIRDDITVSRNSVYGYISLGIKNFNAAQIAKLSNQNTKEINEVLKQNSDVMDFFDFNYEESGVSRYAKNLRSQLTTLYLKHIVRNVQRVNNHLHRS